MKSFALTVRRPRRRNAGVVLLAAVVIFLLLYKIGSLTHGLSASELSAQTGVSINGIWHNPLYLPLKLVRLVLYSAASHPDNALLRLPSVVFGALVFYAFVAVARQWYGWRTTFFVATLFGLSNWFLHTSRLATYDSLYLWTLPTLIAISLALQRSDKKALVFFASPVILSLLLYIPGAVWLVVPVIAWHWRSLYVGWQHFSKRWQRAAWCSLLALSLALLIIALIRTPALIRTWLGLPDHFGSLAVILKSFAAVFEHIFIRGPHLPNLWLANLPVLGIFVTVMFALGTYFYAKHWQAPRSRQLLLFIIISAALVALGGPVKLSLLVPLLYLVAAAGIGYLLRDWFRVFPANPLARGLGIGVLIVAVGFACAYNLRQYFIAWPHNPATQAAFRHRNQN